MSSAILILIAGLMFVVPITIGIILIVLVATRASRHPRGSASYDSGSGWLGAGGSAGDSSGWSDSSGCDSSSGGDSSGGCSSGD